MLGFLVVVRLLDRQVVAAFRLLLKQFLMKCYGSLALNLVG